MHELSIASAILDSAVRLTPAGSVLRRVLLRAGPMRGIEPTAMRWAWQSVTAGTPQCDVELELELPPWQLRCARCHVTFTADNPLAPCWCGWEMAHPLGGDELRIVSLVVEEGGVSGSSAEC